METESVDCRRLEETNANDSGYLGETSFLLSPDATSKDWEDEDEIFEDASSEFNCFAETMNECSVETTDLIETTEELLMKLVISITSPNIEKTAAADTDTTNVEMERTGCETPETVSNNMDSSKNNNGENQDRNEFKRKKSPRTKDQSDEENNFDEKTTDAMAALFQVLFFHDSCDQFFNKAEEMWFWNKSVDDIKFLTAKSWFKELIFYYRRFRTHFQFLLNFAKQHYAKKIYIPESVKINVEFPWELFDAEKSCEEESCYTMCNEEVSKEQDSKPELNCFDNSQTTMKEEDCSKSRNYIYLSEERILMLDEGLVKLLGKFETLLILSSPIGHDYNKNTFLGKKRRSIADMYGIYAWDMPDDHYSDEIDQFCLI